MAQVIISRSKVPLEFYRQLIADFDKVQPAHTATSSGFLYQGRYNVEIGFYRKGDTITFDEPQKSNGQE